jgi:hypothetical protein
MSKLITEYLNYIQEGIGSLIKAGVKAAKAAKAAKTAKAAKDNSKLFTKLGLDHSNKLASKYNKVSFLHVMNLVKKMEKAKKIKKIKNKLNPFK